MFLQLSSPSRRKRLPLRFRSQRFLESLESRRVLAAPVAVDDDFSIVAGTVEVQLDVLQNDSDEDGDFLLLGDISLPSAGGFVRNDIDLITYTPPLGFVGIDEFTYSVTDGSESAAATVRVQIGANSAPFAADDFISVASGQTQGFVFDPFVNDSDPEGDPLQLLSVGTPDIGFATDNLNGRIAYFPADDFVGNDQFSYTVTDGKGGTATASVFVTVEAAMPPRAEDDVTVIGAGETAIINLLQNDSSPDGAPLTLQETTQPQNGLVTVVAEGTVEYTPQNGFVGTDTFHYTVVAPNGLAAQGQVTVEVISREATIERVVVNSDQIDPPDLETQQPTSWQEQRSDIRSVSLHFSSPLGNVEASDLSMTNLGLNAPQDDDILVDLTDDTFVTVRVADNVLTIGFASQYLSTGLFEIGGQVRDANGDRLTFRVLPDANNRLYELPGEWNGDGGVSIFDFAALSYWFGTPVGEAPGYMDLNGDSGVSIFDFSDFAANFSRGVVYPTAKSAGRGSVFSGQIHHFEEARHLQRGPRTPSIAARAEISTPDKVDAAMEDWDRGSRELDRLMRAGDELE